MPGAGWEVGGVESPPPVPDGVSCPEAVPGPAGSPRVACRPRVMYCVVVTDARKSSRSVGIRSSAPDGRRTFRWRAASTFRSHRDHQREVSAFIPHIPIRRLGHVNLRIAGMD